MSEISRLTLGARHDPVRGSTRFRVWAPKARRVEVVLLDDAGRAERVEPLAVEGGEAPEHAGYHGAEVADVAPGRLYRYRLHRGGPGEEESVERPDPASRHQPRGVHGPSAVAPPPAGPGVEGWSGLPLADHVLYELHVGTFSEEGTFDGAIAHLDDLADLGVTAVELMPLAQFPGERNWGYDGVYPFAVQSSYGGPEGLGRFVHAAHQRGLAVVLDVVYNHLGPEGNYLHDFGPYFTDRYATPWGDALNFDGPHSDPVRRFFVENALHWVREHGVDGLRLDAVHAIFDNSERPFLAELAAAVDAEAERRGRRVHLFAESAVNTLSFLRGRRHGGCGMAAQWSDDFHHALHALLTGEDDGYYRDFGRLDQLAKVYRQGFAYTGEYSPYRRRRHGVTPRDVDAGRFVVFIQNHDQTGNRMLGERLATLVDDDSQRLAAAAVLLSPFLPLLFMGEEHGEEAPFQYFVDHGDPELVEAVRRGRAEEFAAFGWTGEVPDPQSPVVFERSRPDRSRAGLPAGQALRDLHRELLRLRREVPALAPGGSRLPLDDRGTTEGVDLVAEVHEDAEVIALHRRHGDSDALVALCFADEPRAVGLELPQGEWEVALDTAAPRWRGEGEEAPALRPELTDHLGGDAVRSAGRAELPLGRRSALLLLRRS